MGGENGGLKQFEAVAQVVETLNAAVDAELRDAAEKIEKSWHWGEVGFVVQRAALDARGAIEAFLPSPMPADSFAWMCYTRLGGLAARHEQSDDDALSYYGPTVYAIMRSLLEQET